MKKYKAIFLVSLAAILFSGIPARAQDNPNIPGCCQFKGTNGETLYQDLILKDCEPLPGRQFSANFHVNATNDGCEPTELTNLGTIGSKTTPSEPIATPLLSVLVPDLTLKPSTCDETTCSSPWLGDYIAGLYKYGVAAVSILAAIALMIAGIIWISSAGNSEQIGQAKKWISGSLVALLLVYSPYVLLSLINGSLLQLKPIKVTYIANQSLDTDDPLVGSFQAKALTYLPATVVNSEPVDQTVPYGISNPFAGFIKTAQAACKFIIPDVNEAVNLKTTIFTTNNVPRIFCPHSGGVDAIPRIIESIQDEGGDQGMITYRFGAKGGLPEYQDGNVAQGGSGDHRCDQDPECTAILKKEGKQNTPNNCKYCCPAGQACLDCSAFTNHVLSCAGLPIIDSSTSTMNSCGEAIKTLDKEAAKVNGKALVPGDLLVMSGHVIMYIGNGDTAESSPGGNADTGRRPGKGLIVKPLVDTSYDKFLNVIRSSEAGGTLVGRCATTDQSCMQNRDCCGSNLCDSWSPLERGVCRTCVRQLNWNCSVDRDCCGYDVGMKCRAQYWQEGEAGPAGEFAGMKCIPDF